MDLAAVAQANHQHPEITYQHRRPKKSVLYQIIQQNLNTLFAQAEAQSDYGFGYPNYVKREFERYLSCGMPCAGFARIRCPDCGYERLLAFSCKARMGLPFLRGPANGRDFGLLGG